MTIHTIDAKKMQQMFLAGAKRIEEKKEYINELNVFPVPDGDTGTNMSLTILAAAKEVEKISEPTMATLAKAISNGSLRGARGNSGVILSQLFRGFTKEVEGVEEVNTTVLAKGFQRAVETAYKAVMKPKEGTILTVAKGMADKANEMAKQTDDIVAFGETVIEYGYHVLAQTPEMLTVLKEAGVVDSGGQGLMEVMQGAFDLLLGKVTETKIEATKQTVTQMPAEEATGEDIKFGYCTEFIIMLEKTPSSKAEQELKEYLPTIGDSLVVVADDEIVKVHVHTNHPGLAFEKALTFGSLSNMKIDNMRIEHQEKLIKQAEQQSTTVTAEEKKEETIVTKEVGFIAVSIGEGMNEILKGLGVDYIIEGGQTMNPSTEDMLLAIEKVPAKTVYILPNNKNIILAANQAKSIVEDKEIIVIPTKTVPQGIAALINYVPDFSKEENEAQMLQGMEGVKTGQVTYAVRNTTIDGKTIAENDIMGIDDDSIQAVGADINEVTLELIDHMIDDDNELICIYYGKDMEEEKAQALVAQIEERYSDLDVELQFGGQPVYYYLISVE
ncbi:MAG: DAK2 domain-containing protein [Lachnospiraceae bacterium]|nr:DAK2 domain-containing protein [Lachnospiraceae bacterium]